MGAASTTRTSLIPSDSLTFAVAVNGADAPTAGADPVVIALKTV
jgi:hypothetical protein